MVTAVEVAGEEDGVSPLEEAGTWVALRAVSSSRPEKPSFHVHNHGSPLECKNLTLWSDSSLDLEKVC